MVKQKNDYPQPNFQKTIQNTSFNPSIFHNDEQICDISQTPKFYSEINIESIKQNHINNNINSINQLLQSFRCFGIEIEQASQHQLQSNQDSYQQELFSLNQSSFYKQKLLEKGLEKTSSNVNKSFFFADTYLLKIIKSNCLALKREMLILPAEINQIISQVQQFIKCLTQNIISMTTQLINKSLQKMHEQMDQILKNQQQTQEENRQLRSQLQRISKEYINLKKQNDQMITIREQYQQLQKKNQEQAELITELHEKINELQHKFKESQTNYSMISSQFLQSNVALQQKYQKLLEEMKVALTHQIKVEMYYKFKYGYSLQFDTFQQRKLGLTNLKLSKSDKFQQINEVVNSIKEINSCLLERSKIFT